MDRPRLVPGKTETLLGICILFGLFLTSLHSYLLFHSLTEIFSIVIACGIFVVAWNSRRLLDNNYLLFLGIAFLFVAAMDLLHMLSYKGMGVFQAKDANLPSQLWIATRYLESVSFLIAPLFLDRSLNYRHVFTAYAFATLLLSGSIFYWNLFPICFVEGSGLTRFKIVSEYLICLIFSGSAFLLYKNRKNFEPSVFQLLIGSIVVTVFSELAFTLYTDVYGIFNMLGHLLEIISSYLIYKAIIQTGLIRPFNLLFRNLKLSEQKLFSVLEGLPAFVYLQSTDYHIRFANRYFLDHFGAPDGRSCYQILHGADEPCKECSTFKVLETNTAQVKEWNRFDHTTYQVYDYPFPDEADGEMQVLKLGIDITERKTAEKLLRKAHEELEARVLARTSELRMSNEALQLEIEERERMEEALLESQRELRALSSQLITAQEEERKRIAMELHDSIGASLSAVKFSVENSIVRNSRDISESILHSLQAIVPMMQNAVDEVRRIHTGIWPSILDDLGVVAAISWFCRNYQISYPQIAIASEIDIDERYLSDPLKIVIYRIIQEALNNIAKHSGANAVQLLLRSNQSRVELVIQDNGTGFDMQSVKAKKKSQEAGMGLSSMKERARLSGGRFEITSVEGEGTTIRSTWPFTHELAGTHSLG